MPFDTRRLSVLYIRTFEDKNNNEHSKYVEILILIEQHSNFILSSAAFSVT